MPAQFSDLLISAPRPNHTGQGEKCTESKAELVGLNYIRIPIFDHLAIWQATGRLLRLHKLANARYRRLDMLTRVRHLLR